LRNFYNEYKENYFNKVENCLEGDFVKNKGGAIKFLEDARTKFNADFGGIDFEPGSGK
jgi:hypothetical protein